MVNAGILNVEGVNFILQRKQEMASLLKQRMVNKPVLGEITVRNNSLIF
jgi:hypothetical protein